jgi:hypothetical protein
VRDLDRACLLLCLALLDHTIQGDHFESVVLSFLAVLGIDESPDGVFRGPLSYSPDLSKFIKMAQMLVVQRSVVAAEEGKVEHPSDMLDKMREQFMVRRSRTAFDWACRLQSYAKKVVSNTTSLGYIAWSEDGSSVTYKDTGFSMDALRKFIAVQVDKGQKERDGLLLLHPNEVRNGVVPQVLLYRGNASRLFTTIALDLVAHEPGMLSGIRKTLDEDSVISQRALKDQFKKLILGPLLGVHQARQQGSARVVVIDALDECEQEVDIRAIQLLACTKDIQQFRYESW